MPKEYRNAEGVQFSTGSAGGRSRSASGNDAWKGGYGIWYDALSSLTDQIEAAPANKALQEARADLLRQAGLKVSVGNQPFAAK